MVVGAADELLTYVEALPETYAAWVPQMNKVAREQSFKFTLEFVSDAVFAGQLGRDRARELRRMMHADEISPKEVRDVVAAEATETRSRRDNPAKGFDRKVADWQETVNKMHPILKKQKLDREYAEMIAKDNRAGLVLAASQGR